MEDTIREIGWLCVPIFFILFHGFRLFFNIDSDSPTAELLEESEEKATLDSLLDMIADGRNGESENKIFEITENLNKENLEIALLIYSYLNNKSNGFLEEHNFSCCEVKQGLYNVAFKYGLHNIVEIFLQ